jgi:hypothetical protein
MLEKIGQASAKPNILDYLRACLWCLWQVGSPNLLIYDYFFILYLESRSPAVGF